MWVLPLPVYNEVSLSAAKQGKPARASGNSVSTSHLALGAHWDYTHGLAYPDLCGYWESELKSSGFVLYI